jgi:thiamine-monophosphate kinase
MPLSEFDLIKRYFTHSFRQRTDVELGIGDDAALLRVPEGQSLVMSMDTLVEGVHFPVDTTAANIAYKALAVNLSDLAAMGAEPCWMMLALTLSEADENWLNSFSEALGGLAAEHGVALIGGDTTHGPLSVTVQINGLVPQGKALRRSGARPGDLIYVTGTLGDAALGLQLKMNQLAMELPLPRRDYFISRLERPTARVAAGVALRGLVHAAIDISDGLLADLGHILEAGDVAAQIELEQLPVAEEIKGMSPTWWELPLAGGDDYELCFTVAPQDAEQVKARLAALDCPFTCIGRIEAGSGVTVLHNGSRVDVSALKGYLHFG